MANQSQVRHAQNVPEVAPLPPNNPQPLVVVVGCEVDINHGCFSITGNPTHHHQRAEAHKTAMSDWAIGQGMYQRDATDLVEREPVKFDEAIYELLTMDAARLDGLNNIGGWLVWFVRNKATGARRWVDPRPKGRAPAPVPSPYSSLNG